MDNTNNSFDQISAAEDLLKEALRNDNPNVACDSVCAIADEILGPSMEEINTDSLRTGLMNTNGALQMLEEIQGVLQSLTKESLDPANAKKAREYIALLDVRVNAARSADVRVQQTRNAVRKSSGEFTAFAA